MYNILFAMGIGVLPLHFRGRGRYAKASTTETVLSVADLSRDREKKVLELVENHCRFMNIGNVEGQMACFGDRIFKYFDKGQVGKSFIMKDIKNHTRPYEIFATDLLDVKANKRKATIYLIMRRWQKSVSPLKKERGR